MNSVYEWKMVELIEKYTKSHKSWMSCSGPKKYSESKKRLSPKVECPGVGRRSTDRGLDRRPAVCSPLLAQRSHILFQLLAGAPPSFVRQFLDITKSGIFNMFVPCQQTHPTCCLPCSFCSRSLGLKAMLCLLWLTPSHGSAGEPS